MLPASNIFSTFSNMVKKAIEFVLKKETLTSDASFSLAKEVFLLKPNGLRLEDFYSPAYP